MNTIPKRAFTWLSKSAFEALSCDARLEYLARAREEVDTQVTRNHEVLERNGRRRKGPRGGPAGLNVLGGR